MDSIFFILKCALIAGIVLTNMLLVNSVVTGMVIRARTPKGFLRNEYEWEIARLTCAAEIDRWFKLAVFIEVVAALVICQEYHLF